MNTVRARSIVLEPQVADHAKEMFVVLSDPAIYEFENFPPESQTALERRYAALECRASPDSGEHWLNWVIRLPTGELAGYVQATIARDGPAKIAYELGSRFWRRGIGTAAVTTMLDELAGTYGVRFVMAILKAKNYRSLGLLQKMGFAEAGPGSLPGVQLESDELVMVKGLGESAPTAAKTSSGFIAVPET